MRQALGKGLDALFKQAPENYGDYGQSVIKIPVGKIKPNRFQPRKIFSEESIKELSQSITKHGLTQPLIVTQNGADYEIVAGERRFRACRMAGLKEVDAIIRPALDSEQLLALSLVENIQREDLNPIDQALAFSQLTAKFSVPQTELARYCGKSKAAISNCLRLLELEPEMQKALQSGALSEGHGRALLSVPDRSRRKRLFLAAIEGKMTVRQLEDAAHAAGAARKPRSLATAKSADVRACETRLERALGAKTEIRPGRKNGGTLVIRYNSLDQLEMITSRLSGNFR